MLIEWYQCPKCGRRERWRAEIAGAEVECLCGAWVLCPDVDELDASSVSTTEDSSEGLVAIVQAPRDADAVDDELIETVDEPSAEEKKRQRVHRLGRIGVFGLTACGRVVLWFVLSLAGFTLIVFALYMQTSVYIASASVVAPVSWFCLWRAQREWLIGRGLLDGLQSLAEGRERLRVR
ncbi:MAG: hypothetical protein ACF8MJ_08690 [Phycisphaerales bacterium JB050]